MPSFSSRLPLAAGFMLLTIAQAAPVNAQVSAIPFVPVRHQYHHPPFPRKKLDPKPGKRIFGGFSPNYRMQGSFGGGMSGWSEIRGAATGGPGSVTSLLGLDWLSVGSSSQLTPSGYIASNTPSVSGRVAAIATDPTDANTFYVGPAGGGVWKTTNGGRSYTPLTDFAPGLATGAIAVAPSNHNVVYVGSGEANFSGDNKYGNGIYKSTDGGSTWTVIPGPSDVFVRRSVSKIVIHPNDPNTVYAALVVPGTVGGLYDNMGVWKTTDGGTTWINTTSSLGTLLPFPPFYINGLYAYTDLAIDPSNPNTLYVGVWDLFNFWQLYGMSGPDNGVYKSTDGGATWTLTGTGTDFEYGRISLALAPSNPQVIYASIMDNFFGGLLTVGRSTDGGVTWDALYNTPDYLGGFGGQGSYDNVIIVHPTNPNKVFAAGQVNYGAYTWNDLIGVVATNDGGNNWGDLSVANTFLIPHTDHHAMAFTKDNRLLLGSDGGVWRLENATTVNPPPHTYDWNKQVMPWQNGVHWTCLNANLSSIQFTGIALHPTDPSIAYGGSQDNGTARYNGSTWTQVIGGDGGFARVNQSHPKTVYHEYYSISLERSDDEGQTWYPATNGIDYTEYSEFYVPYILDPANQSRMFLGAESLYESKDGGNNWFAISFPGYNGFNIFDTPNDPPYQVEVINAIGVNGDTIYCAIGGLLYATPDEGYTWTFSDPTGNQTPLADIYVNPNYAPDVIVVVQDFTGSANGHVFRSTDSGATWKDISGNLPDQPYNAVKMDKKSGTIYVGGDDGVYYSKDMGATWARLGNTLPHAQVADLTLSPGTGRLGAGTHGRGLWVYPLFTTTAATNLSVQPAIFKVNGKQKFQITLQNGGMGDATHVKVTSVTINGTAVAGGAQKIGTVAAMSSLSDTPVSVTVASGTATVSVAGTSDQGAFSATVQITVP